MQFFMLFFCKIFSMKEPNSLKSSIPHNCVTGNIVVTSPNLIFLTELWICYNVSSHMSALCECFSLFCNFQNCGAFTNPV